MGAEKKQQRSRNGRKPEYFRGKTTRLSRHNKFLYNFCSYLVFLLLSTSSSLQMKKQLFFFIDNKNNNENEEKKIG